MEAEISKLRKEQEILLKNTKQVRTPHTHIHTRERARERTERQQKAEIRKRTLLIFKLL